jgi:hypothetical protein
MRMTFDGYNETCEMIDGCAAIHPHHLGLMMLRGVSSTGPFGEAKHCVINAFDTNYLMSADEVMAIILHMARNMDEELLNSELATPGGPASPIFAFVAVGRGSHGGRGHNNRGGRGGLGMPNKCSACGILSHILSLCKASDDALLKWTLAWRKMIIHKYGTPGGIGLADAALMSDVPTHDVGVMPTMQKCPDEYNNTKVRNPLRSHIPSPLVVTFIVFG